MARLVINPNTPQACEYGLKPGNNFLGRAFANDIQIDSASVSSSHCQIVVDANSAFIRDLGSTNGTFVNSAQIREAHLSDGHIIHLGGVEMVFHGDVPPPPAVVTVTPSPPIPSIRISRAAAPPAPAAPPVMETAVEASRDGASVLMNALKFCKFHPKSIARFLCNKCGRYFCDFCVVSREGSQAAKKLCRTCGVAVTLVEYNIAPKAERGFFASIPGAFIYPIRGFGPIILICAAVVMSVLGYLGGGIGIGAKIVFYGFLFLFMQNIIFGTTSDESENLSLPDMSDFISGAFTLVGTVLMSFGLPIGLFIARLSGVEIPAGVIVAATIFGCLYFPMALLVVAIKDTVMAGNPLIVVPSIMKVPFQYLVTTVFLMGVFGLRMLGNIVSGVAGAFTFSTTDMGPLFISIGIQALWAFASVYLLTVTIRVLGLFYNANKDELGWF